MSFNFYIFLINFLIFSLKFQLLTWAWVSFLLSLLAFSFVELRKENQLFFCLFYWFKYSTFCSICKFFVAFWKIFLLFINIFLIQSVLISVLLLARTYYCHHLRMNFSLSYNRHRSSDFRLDLVSSIREYLLWFSFVYHFQWR